MGSRALCGRWFAMSGLEASMKLKILAIVALGVVGIGAAFVALGGLPASASATTQYLTGAVTTGDVSDDVAATGTLAATASYGVSFGSPARRGRRDRQQRHGDMDDPDGQGRRPATPSRRGRSLRRLTPPTSGVSTPMRRPR